MKYKLTFASLLVVISSLLACSTKTEEPVAAPVIDKEQIKKEIQARENEYAALYNSRELKSIGYYADDAITYSQNREPLVGKEDIVEYLKAGLDSMIDGLKISFETKEVFVSNDGDMVIEIGYYKLVDSLNTDYNSGNYMVLFEKRNGKYVSVREMSTSDLPLD